MNTKAKTYITLTKGQKKSSTNCRALDLL